MDYLMISYYMGSIAHGMKHYKAAIERTFDLSVEITNTEGMLITAGPHRTGWEAFVLVSKIKGTPPQFFATDVFNVIPGVSSFLKMFKVITVEAKAKKNEHGQSANAGALEKASQALKEHGCVALFPQGNFSKIGQEPPKVYGGAAQLAVMNNRAIHVVRLDGFWCLQNPLIPIFMRNSLYYRAFMSGLHMNNVRTTLCSVIDFHLQPEHADLSDALKIREISAQLYAFYRHTEDLTPEQISVIKTEIANQTHLLIWDNKLEQLRLKKEASELEASTSQSIYQM